MTIKQQGGVFGRNPTFNDVTVESDLVSKTLTVDGGTLFVDAVNDRVGVNETSPDTKLHLKGSGGTETSIKLQNTSGSADGPWLLSAGQPGLGNTGFSIYDVANARSSFHVNSAGDARVTAGNLIIGTSGKGIDFSATSGTGTSELFDDYEEGTWTPTIEGSTTAGAQTYNAQVAKYTKVGRTVTIYAYVSITTKDAAMAGNVRIGGLPYASDGTSNALQALALGDFQGVTFGAIKTQLLLRIPNNVTKINVYDGGSGLASAQIPVSNINNATYFVVGGTYQTA